MDEKMTQLRILLLLALIGAAGLVSGCSEARHITAALASSSKAYQEFMEDPVALTTIKTVAVFPFDDRAPQPGFDADVFANKLANQLAAHGKVRVLYPRDILEQVERENREARRHNVRLKEEMSLGLSLRRAKADGEDGIFSDDGPEEAKPRRYYNPVKNVEEAVRLARRVKADAVIVGEVSDYDPYMRPRLSLTMRLIATGNSDTAAKAIAELTQWGIPRPTSGASGTIYIRQESFDSTKGSVGMDVSRYGRTHFVDHHPYDTEVYIRSMTYYYDVVANQLALAYMEARKKAVKEAEDRARAEARAKKQDQDAAAKRLFALMERDGRIPDYETDAHGQEHFDQAFPERYGVIDANNGDKRIQSWRADGRSIRPASAGERTARDGMIPENERGRGLEGYPTHVDSAFLDADELLEQNLGDNRDRSWRPDYYMHANPRKAAPMYAPSEFRGQ